MKDNEPTVVLFARADSIYYKLGCDVYDRDRNALTYTGQKAVIAHPPCRAWGRLKHFARPLPGEKELAIWAVDLIRKNGGVLEHPAGSSLWAECRLGGDKPDKFGGWTLSVNQSWWGHRAQKRTYLYIVGCSPSNIPSYSIPFNAVERIMGKVGQDITKAEREHTPIKFAKWLIELCSLCGR